MYYLLASWHTHWCVLCFYSSKCKNCCNYYLISCSFIHGVQNFSLLSLSQLIVFCCWFIFRRPWRESSALSFTNEQRRHLPSSIQGMQTLNKYFRSGYLSCTCIKHFQFYINFIVTFDLYFCNCKDWSDRQYEGRHKRCLFLADTIKLQVFLTNAICTTVHDSLFSHYRDSFSTQGYYSEVLTTTTLLKGTMLIERICSPGFMYQHESWGANVVPREAYSRLRSQQLRRHGSA